MIFHLAEPADWAATKESYVAPSLATEGFIHFSTASQLDATAALVFPGRTDLVLLTVDESLLDHPVVYEDLYDAGEDFPHVYGPIPLSAIVAVGAYPDLDPND